MTTKVFLVDDHEIVRRGLADLLGNESDIEISGEAAAACTMRCRVESSSIPVGSSNAPA